MLCSVSFLKFGELSKFAKPTLSSVFYLFVSNAWGRNFKEKYSVLRITHFGLILYWY